MRHPIVKITFLTTLLFIVVALSCHETVSLPPVKGPPIEIPEHRGTSPGELAARPLEIIHVSPKGQLKAPHTQIAISFNKPMVSLEKVEDRARKSPAVIKPAVRGKQRWLGSRTLILEPDKPLRGSTEYSLTIPKGIKALDGSELEQGKTWSFTTPRLAVSRVYPGPGARWAKPDTKVSLFFNQPVKPSVLEKHAFFLVAGDGGKAKPYTITAQAKQGKNNKHMVLHPTTAFPKDARITVQLSKELKGAEGPLPMDKTYASSFRTYGPFRVIGLSCTESCDPDYSVRVSFSNPARRSEARKAIRINGRRMKGGSSRYFTSSVYLEGRRRPRARYSVTVGPLTDRFGQKLERPRKPLTFKTGDYEPMVHFPLDRAGVLEASAPKRLPLYFRNAQGARLLSKRLTEAEVVSLLNKDLWEDSLFLPGFSGVKERKIRAAGRPNARVVRRVDLGRLLGRNKRGILALELETKLRRQKKIEEEISRTVVRVTDLALTAKYSPHTSLLWVTSLSKGRPVPGCEVAIWRPGGKRALWRGRTDASGLAVGPGVNNLGGGKENRRFIFFARKNTDESYVLSGTQSGISPWDFGYTGTWEDPASNLLGMIFTDRGIFRPGERVHVKGVFRRSGPRGLVTPQGMKVDLTVNDARGEQLKVLNRRLNEFGSLDFELELPPGASLGSYSIVGKAEGGGTIYGSFRVEEYRPAEFKVEVRPERKEYVRGESMTWTSTGTYLFGAAMRGVKARWYVHQNRSYYNPPKHDGFVFSDEVRWWRDDEKSSSVPFIARGDVKLNDRGQMSTTVPLRPQRMPWPMTYEIETTVTDVSRQTVSSRASVLLHPGEFYVGAKPKETFLKAGDSLEAELVAVAPDGKRVEGQRISGTLYRRTWHSVRKSGMGGSQYFVTRPKDTQVGQCTARSTAKPQPCKIPVAKAGYYFLRLSAKDKRRNPLSSSFGIYVAGPDYVPWRRDDESRVELVTDRKKYKIGQTARILIKSPFTNAHGMFTVERSGILTRRPFKLKGTSVWMEVPITKDLVPDAYVSVVLVRGRVPATAKMKKKGDEEDPGKPTFKVGYAKLAISQDDQRLRVSVKPVQKEYRPGQQAAVEFLVKDARGKPAKAELTVIVADEGVLSLIGYRTPDPMATFYADRGLSVRTADNRIRLISRRVFGEKGKNPGGGGGGEGDSGSGGVRRNFVSTPYFNPSVVTDGSGRARVTFKLPDNLTTFRIMAVATSAAANFGNGQSQVKVNKPLLLLQALPRLVRVGDSIEAGVVVHNHSGKSGQVRVSAEVKGLRLTGKSMMSVSVKNGASAEARFAMSAHTPGEAVLRFDARLEDHHDGLELRKPVKLAMVTETVATHGSTIAAVAEGIAPSKGIRPDVGGLEVAMSSSALVGMKGGVEYLLEYPYECLEQTTSRMVPLVSLKDLTKAFGLKSAKPEQIDAQVGRLLAKIQTLQRWSGGFSYWPSSHHTSPWASAYATWGLAKAKKGGYKVSDKVLERAKRFLKNQLRRRTPKDADDAKLALTTKAFLVHVLTELGEKPAGYVNNLYERRADLAVFAKALLLSSVSRLKLKTGDDMIEKLIDELGNQIHQTARVAKVEENLGDGYAPLFHSNVRSTALVLQALLEARPNHMLVEKLVRYLIEARKDGRWRNTQETVYCLLALQSYYHVREKDPPDFIAKVVLGEKTVVQKKFKGRSLAMKHHQVPMSKLLGYRGSLGFVKQGTGRLYYSARLRYARSTLPKTAWDEGFFVSRTYERVPQDGSSSMSALRGNPKASDSALKKKSVKKVKAGDLVRVTLRIIVPQQMHFVVVDDPMPAGLEAINFRLMTAASSLRRGANFFGYGSRHGRRRYSSSWYTPFYHREIRDDRVQLFADSVPPGVHTYVYLARATTIGKFVAAPTYVEQMYEPEVFGRTGASDFEVTAK